MRMRNRDQQRKQNMVLTESLPSLLWKLYPNMWKSSAGIYALKTWPRRKTRDYGFLSFTAGS